MTCRTVLASLLIFAAGLSGVAPAVAEPLDELTVKLEIAVQLEQQGYRIIEIDRTWLGRIRIAAENDRYRREIVFDRVTGEIRRDLVEDKAGGATALPNLADVVGRGGNVVSTRNRPLPPGAAGGDKGQGGGDSNQGGSGIGNYQSGGGVGNAESGGSVGNPLGVASETDTLGADAIEDDTGGGDPGDGGKDN